MAISTLPSTMPKTSMIIAVRRARRRRRLVWLMSRQADLVRQGQAAWAGWRGAWFTSAIDAVMVMPGFIGKPYEPERPRIKTS